MPGQDGRREARRGENRGALEGKPSGAVARSASVQHAAPPVLGEEKPLGGDGRGGEGQPKMRRGGEAERLRQRPAFQDRTSVAADPTGSDVTALRVGLVVAQDLALEGRSLRFGHVHLTMA